jgi:FkbM family methyltransferase
MQERVPYPLHLVRVFRHVLWRPFEAELRWVNRFCGSRAVAIDVGANVGLYSYVLARNAAKVLTVEPNPALARYLRRVLPKNCEVLELALSDSDVNCRLRIPTSADGIHVHYLGTIEARNPLAGYETDELQVTATTIDSICRTLDSEISLIKIDVEGHELAVLDGGRRTIENNLPVMLIEVEPRHNAKWRDVFSFLTARGYQTYRRNGNRLVECHVDEVPQLQSELGSGASWRRAYINNFFFVPPRLRGKDLGIE